MEFFQMSEASFVPFMGPHKPIEVAISKRPGGRRYEKCVCVRATECEMGCVCVYVCLCMCVRVYVRACQCVRVYPCVPVYLCV
jgi:hypothetical protein